MVKFFFNKKAFKAKSNLDDVLNAFQKIDLGKKMIDWSQENGIKIVMKDGFGKGKETTGAYYASHNKTVYLNSEHSIITNICCLAHELRHAWQHMRVGERFVLKRRNSFAGVAHVRFIEADAFSFQNLFLVRYFQKFGDGELDNLDSGSASYMEAVLFMTPEINPDDPVALRRKGFDIFFVEGAKTIRSSYDKSNLNLFMLLNSVSEVCAERLLFLGILRNVLKLTEETLLTYGEDAWGECKGENYLTSGKNPLVIGPEHTDNLDKSLKRPLNILKVMPTHLGMNHITLKDGTKQRLIYPNKVNKTTTKL